MAAVGVASRPQPRRDDLFASVFPPATFTTPTPESTPNIGVLGSPGRPFGGFNVGANAADDAVKHARTWSTITRYLSQALQENASRSQASPDTAAAFIQLCQTSEKELLDWYEHDITVHFRSTVVPRLSAWQQPIPLTAASSLLALTVDVLESALNYYMSPLLNIRPFLEDPVPRGFLGMFQRAFKQRFHTLVLNSLPRQRVQKTLASVFYRQITTGMKEARNSEECLERRQCQCPLSLETGLLSRLHAVGLGGDLGEKAFALAITKFLEGPAVERQGFQVDWSGQTTCMPMLRCWVYHCFVPFLERCLAALTGARESTRMKEVAYEGFGRIAIVSLGRKRTAALFDYVKAWPESTGAILDLMEYIHLREFEEKAQLCASFVNQCQTRLLHAGASTTEILSIYVNVIHAFRLLDARGVLLEKVAAPLRSYLRSREDTVNIIAASFLADVDEEGKVSAADAEKVCVDIAAEVANPISRAAPEQRSLHWDDMEWVPDPIDAGPDYKVSKHEDIVAYILGLFDQDDFVKEITNVLAQHLLHTMDVEYVKETRLVELLKSRLDATKLQAAEVMLKDMRDSVSLNKRINPSARFEVVKPPSPAEIKEAIPEDGITLQPLYEQFKHRVKQAQFHAMLMIVANRRQDVWFAKRTRTRGSEVLSPEQSGLHEDPIDFKVQMLSSFFWPQMRANDFDIPEALKEREEHFEAKFEELGNQRKVEFKHALARVDVELELEDRRVVEKAVPLWRASVVDAIAYQESEGGVGEGMTVDGLVEMCSMEEELVTDALAFWIGKRVLYQPRPGHYAVLERLDMDVQSSTLQQQQQPESVSAVMSQDAMLREGAPMFETFIANMLRNGGPKSVEGMMGITNMLKMVLPTFTYGDAEVKWLLTEMEDKGMVRRDGEAWVIGG